MSKAEMCGHKRESGEETTKNVEKIRPVLAEMFKTTKYRTVVCWLCTTDGCDEIISVLVADEFIGQVHCKACGAFVNIQIEHNNKNREKWIEEACGE